MIHMVSKSRLSWIFRVLLVCCLGTAANLPAQGPAPGPPGVDLSSGQKQLLRDYERFEKALFDIAEQARRKDPDRAELLYRARSRSQEDKILSEMEAIAALLSPGDPSKGPAPPQYGSAADRQKEVLTRLESVLKLLQSLDERARIDEEIKRIQELLKDANRLIAREKDVRAETRRGKSADQLKNAQQKVLDETDKLAEKIDRQDEARKREQDADKSGKSDSPSDSKPDEPSDSPDSPKPGDRSPEEKPQNKPGPDSKPSPGEKPSAGESKPSQPSPMDQSPPGQSPQNQPPQPQQPGQPPSSPDKPQEQPTAGREQLEQARRDMQQAIEELERDNRDKAAEEQDQAVARLEEMKAQLEEILRQLREEEKESWLTLLEARLQGMLKRQQQINSETVRLHAIPEGNRAGQNYAAQSGSVRKEQSDNAIEAEKTLNLLKEEGSSVAFPEAVEQMHKNMLTVVNRLGNLDTGETTQLLEKLIAETLEEMIAAFQKELEKQQEKKRDSGSPQGQPQDPSLVNQIAELKLIRSLQNQVNRLTKQIGVETGGKIPADADQLRLIEDLSARQQRIQDATYDLSVGRNR